jgi:hypothetical protein
VSSNQEICPDHLTFQTPSKNTEWENAIAEALRPGASPVPFGRSLAFWRTGQVLSSKRPPNLEDDVTWAIVKTDKPGPVSKQEIYVRLEKKVTLDALRLITKEILKRADYHPRISYVHFYTPWSLGETRRESEGRRTLSDVGNWASSRLDLRDEVELTVTIHGLTVEDEAVLKAVPSPPGVKVVGSWLSDRSQERQTIYRLADDRLLLEERFSSGEKVREDHELIELPTSVGRRFEDRSPQSDRDISYFLIDETGDLQTRFKDGMVWRAQSIE